MKFQTIKILADENISPKVVAFLRQSGLDVLDTKELHWHGQEDDELLKAAYKDNQVFGFTGRCAFWGFNH